MATNWQCQDFGEVKFGAEPGVCMSCGGADFQDMDEPTYATILLRERNELRATVARMRAALARAQKPEGERAAQVAEWLRGQGYSVTDLAQS